MTSSPRARIQPASWTSLRGPIAMRHRPHPPQTSEPGAANAGDKRAWERPRILSREPLEGVAVVCIGGTAKSDVFVCPGGPITS